MAPRHDGRDESIDWFADAEDEPQQWHGAYDDSYPPHPADPYHTAEYDDREYEYNYEYDYAGPGDQPDYDRDVPERNRPEPRRRRPAGAHRLPPPPNALKGRAAVLAVAAGAVVAAGQSAVSDNGVSTPSTTELAAAKKPLPPGSAEGSTGPQVLDVSQSAHNAEFTDILHRGKQHAQAVAAREAALARPMFMPFTHGVFTSGFGLRWGALHAGVDIAAPVGTPIYAVADGVVLEAGPAAGFGMWVRLQHPDGTVTVYGHVNTTTVREGQKVTAGDQIATVGNRGFSTGPHCHFEVWKNGSTKVDPLPWLANRGIRLGPQGD